MGPKVPAFNCAVSGDSGRSAESDAYLVLAARFCESVSQLEPTYADALLNCTTFGLRWRARMCLSTRRVLLISVSTPPQSACMRASVAFPDWEFGRGDVQAFPFPSLHPPFLFRRCD